MAIPNPYDDADAAYKACLKAAVVELNRAIGNPPGSGERSQDATAAMALVLLCGELRAFKASQPPIP